ncbi:MAG TPA: tetratricopeptide repeat protein [Thermoanaerobaculia bacterium]|nr:tetratricopeptide repeat protein [Thermoanaerobaculia bacterium]
MSEDLAAHRHRGTGRRIAAAEEGRRRIAREVHDDFSQRLAALAFELKATRKKLPDGDPRRSELDAIGGSMAELGEDLRRLSHDLHPTALERRGLATALRDHCGEIERRHGLPVELGLSGAEDSFPPDIALGLYRIVQEALANTVRHSDAGTARVTLSVTAGAARLAVSDDGIGFDPGEAGRTGGLGLASIEERAQWLGGRCRIASAPGDGTEIEVTVPLPAPDGTFSQLGELVRRHRGLVASAALVILALATGLVATALQAQHARQETRRADAAAQFLEGLFQASDPRQARGHPPDARELLRRGTQRLGGELQDQPLLRARLLDTLGGIHTELALFDEARPLLTEALEIRERLLGKEDPEVAETLVRLGALAHLSGKGDAVALFRRALAIREARFGGEHQEVADVLNKLGVALAARGRFDEAEAALSRSLALEERLWGKDDPRVAKVLHNLSGIALHRGRTAEAERLLSRALAIREKALAADDPDLAGSLEALALVRRKQGRLEEAAELLERLVVTAEKVYGPEHPACARALLNLGLVRQSLGEDAAARRLLERARAIYEAKVEPTHPELVKTLAALAELENKPGSARAKRRP